MPLCTAAATLTDPTPPAAPGVLAPPDVLRNVAASPFPPHWQELPDGTMHYVDQRPAGDAAGTLLFVHGNPTWSYHWRRLIGGFRDRWRCIAPDHLGCGLSDLQPRPLRLADHVVNLSELVRQLDLHNVTLVAQDWGGAIGLGTLLAERERFDRIVLLNTGAFRPWFCPWRIRVCRWPVVGKLALQGANAFSRAALRMTLSRTARLAPEDAAAYLAPYDSWRRRAAVYQFVRDIPLSPRHPTWATLGKIEDRLGELADMPATLIWGEQDWCFTPECRERFEQVWPQAASHRIEDAGHWVVEDAPEDVERLMRESVDGEGPSQ